MIPCSSCRFCTKLLVSATCLRSYEGTLGHFGILDRARARRINILHLPFFHRIIKYGHRLIDIISTARTPIGGEMRCFFLFGAVI